MFDGSFDIDTDYCLDAYQIDYYQADVMKLYLFTFDLVDGSVKGWTI